MFKSEEVLNWQPTQMVEDKNRCIQGCVCMYECKGEEGGREGEEE